MEYFIFINGEKKGPYVREQLSSMWSAGNITSDTLYWQEGFDEWRPIQELMLDSPGLLPSLAAASLASLSNPPTPATEPPSGKRKMKLALWWTVGIIIAAGLGVLIYYKVVPLVIADYNAHQATPAPASTAPAPTTATETPVAPPAAPAPAVSTTAPDFGPYVLIFDPSMHDIQQRIDPLASALSSVEFSPFRYAFLFKPGTYDVNVSVGYYMSFIGLGQTPDKVSIASLQTNTTLEGGNATTAFWRSVENLSVGVKKPTIWAVSQGTTMRRVHVLRELLLAYNGWSSGGYMADTKVNLFVNPSSQQQWIARNCLLGTWKGGVWNIVFVGCPDAPTGWPPFTTVPKTPVIAEKPYLYVDDGGNYFVKVPALRKDSDGVTWPTSKDAAPDQSGTSISIAQFHIARPERDTAASINAALKAGKNLIFTPGIYHLEASIEITRPGTVVLGLGYPTLIPDKGTPAMKVTDVDGVRLGGLLFQAGIMNSPSLLQIGEPGSKTPHAESPTILYDIFARVGGPAPGSTDAMVTINSNDTIGDNFWLWRADHGQGVGWNANKDKNGIVVNGANVTVYGLAVEHTQQYQTLWNADGGRVYMYQSEIPYDVPSQKTWRADANGYASYKVADTVTNHEAWGLGVYSLFMDGQAVLQNAYEVPLNKGVRLHHMTSINFGGDAGGDSGIAHVIDGMGDGVQSGSKFMKTTMDEWPMAGAGGH